jgi:mRNA interferase HigB
MLIIPEAALEEWSQEHASAKNALQRWAAIIRSANYERPMMLKEQFSSADFVEVASGRRVVVFNIKGNDYRLIASVNFDFRAVTLHYFLTHAEYSKNKWQKNL